MVVAALALVAGAPAPAPAYDGPGCSRSWNAVSPYSNSGSAKCTILVGTCMDCSGGTPIDLSGTASATATHGNASIRVWITPGDNPELVLAECTEQGTTYADCGTQLTPIVVDAVLPRAGTASVTLVCHASWTGNREGDAGCFGSARCPAIGDPGCISVLGEPLEVP